MATERESGLLPVAVDVSAIHMSSGGARTYVRELVRSLPAQRVSPVLVGRRNDESLWPGAMSLHRRAPGMRVARLIWEQAALARVVAGLGERPTVLHSPHYTMPEHLPDRAQLARVVTIHDMTFFTRPERHQRAKILLFRRAIRVAARRADALVCVSDRTAQLLTETVMPRAPVHVIPHGVDLGRFSPEVGHDDERVLASFGLCRPYIVHVGAIEPRKNLAALIEAHEQLIVEGVDVDLVLVGTEPRGTTVAMPPGAVGRVKRLGFVIDDVVPVLLRHAAVAAYPSVEEGFGLPVLEALAVGTSVVTTEGSVMADLAGDAARYAPAGDIAALSGALLDAMGPDDAMRPAGLARAAQYSWDRCAASHAELYRSLASA